ncbi:MAG TPA: enoyl-CoA hydratase/isomerase family protein [Ilumatobacter sp.]|nr:enoyl-CoA hydratase/isomerase family protein [Ilumatobacter sp.]
MSDPGDVADGAVPDASSGDLLVTTVGEVATIEIVRPPNNYFDVRLVAQIVGACRVAAGQGCRAVLLCSRGRHFCAGANLAGDRVTSLDGKHLYDYAIELFEQPLPIVAAVQGGAIGGGLGLALAADLRIASPEARFSANFATLGLSHGFGLTETLPLAVGHETALRLLYTGERVTGDAALSMGLCTEVVPIDELRDAARRHASAIARSGPLAVRSIRRTMRGALIDRLKRAVEHERLEQDRLQLSADFAEGVAAMAERREPRFTAR